MRNGGRTEPWAHVRRRSTGGRYVLGALHLKLFVEVVMACAVEDAVLVKRAARLTHTPLQDLVAPGGVSCAPAYLEPAVHHMAMLDDFTTPAEKLACIQDALAHIRQQHSGNVLVVSSGGPIGSAVAQVLGAGPEAAIDLHMRIRNTAVTAFSFNPKRHSLLSFNNITHLDDAPYADWVTYA